MKYNREEPKIPACPYCGMNIAVQPRNNNGYHCYYCSHDFDIDDIEKDGE